MSSEKPLQTRPGAIDSKDKIWQDKDRQLGSPIISLYIGPDETPFYVHRDILMEGSGYFRVEFDNSEDQKTIFHFPDVDPVLMGSLIKFIYWPSEVSDPRTATMNHESQVSALVELYILAIRFGVPRLQTKVDQDVASVLRVADFNITRDFEANMTLRIDSIRRVYQTTPSAGDPLRKTLVLSMAQSWELYRRCGMGLDEYGEERGLSKLMGEIPRFAKDLLGYLQSYRPEESGCSKQSDREKKRKF